MLFNRLILTLVVFSLIILASCKNENNEIIENENDTLIIDNNIKSTKLSEIISPVNNVLYTIGDSVLFAINPINEETNIDSVSISIDKKHICTITKHPARYTWKSEIIKVGKNKFSVTTYFSDGKKYKNSVNINLKSDIIPKEYTYKVINEFPHDIKAYTQGLVYENGFIYEGTGQKGESSIQKYKLEDHEIIQSYNNTSDIFGEGIIIINDKLVQLTWHSGIGFVYNKETFKQISKFNIQTEGWGITSDGERLLMSDGTNKIYYLETEVFTKTGEFEVYDNIGKVNYLNELEFIDSMIYANIYTKDKIVIIDPKTGKVNANIDLSGILKPKDKHPKIDVLNGIAWDSENKRLLVTGKYWPKIYEIELIEK